MDEATKIGNRLACSIPHFNLSLKLHNGAHERKKLGRYTPTDPILFKLSEPLRNYPSLLV